MEASKMVLDMAKTHDFQKSILPPDKKELLLKVCEDYIESDDKRSINILDMVWFIERAEAIYQDMQYLDIDISDRLYELLFYHAVYFRVPNNDLDKALYDELMKSLFFNDDLRNAIINTPVNEQGNTEFHKASSSIVSFIKVLGPKVGELLEHTEKQQSYAALKVQKEINDLLIREGIPQTVNQQGNKIDYDDDTIQGELSKRFAPVSRTKMQYLKTYQKVIANPELLGETDFNQLDTPRPFKLYSEEAKALQRVILKHMQDFYQKTGSLLYPYDINTNTYIVSEGQKKYVIYALKYDNLVRMRLYREGLELNWADPDFWVYMLDSKMTFVPGKDAHYLHEVTLPDPNQPTPEEGSKTKPTDITEYRQYRVWGGKKYPDLFFRQKKIIVLEDCMDEAFFKTLSDNDNNQIAIDLPERLEKLGFDIYLYDENQLLRVLTENGILFFRDPKEFYKLTIDPASDGNPKLFNTLKNFKQAWDGGNFKKSYSYAKGRVTKNPKKARDRSHILERRLPRYASSADVEDVKSKVRLPFKDRDEF